jgi:hypothetical protein
VAGFTGVAPPERSWRGCRLTSGSSDHGPRRSTWSLGV